MTIAALTAFRPTCVTITCTAIVICIPVLYVSSNLSGQNLKALPTVANRVSFLAVWLAMPFSSQTKQCKDKVPFPLEYDVQKHFLCVITPADIESILCHNYYCN